TSLLIALFLAGNIHAQKLLDIYKNGPVKLIPDTEFGKTNDWDQIFETYNDTIYGKHIGKRKSLIIMPDGSFIVNHAYRRFFTKFNPDGTFEKEFSIKSSSGKILKTPDINGILNNEIFYTGVTNYGKMFCADLEGNFIKTLSLDYMTSTIITLPNKKLAVVGWAIWKTKLRDFVAIKDYETGEEKIIWDYFAERDDSKIIKVKVPMKNGKEDFLSYVYSGSVQSLRPRPIITITKNNEILLCIPPTGELIFFDLNGRKLRTSKVTWINSKRSVKEQQKLYESRQEHFKSFEKDSGYVKRLGKEGAEKVSKFLIEQVEKEKDLFSIPKDLPYFSTIIQDSDNNILFFEYPKEEGANKFNVFTYNSEGKFVCQSSFICDDYNLVINPKKLVFFNGYLYGLQELKNVEGVPIRLVRFKLEN
ncbi:MAG: hypothetical protein KAT38_12590, partial [Bacteroidales bacterium]|nr:hypothetical protein [Bacteroidales bacterium]